MNLDYSVTRPQEELQTLERFVCNQGKKFYAEKAIQDRLKLREPADVLYEGIEYQITYGDRERLSERRKVMCNKGIYPAQILSNQLSTYADRLLRTALEDKKYKSHHEMILLIDCMTTALHPFKAREAWCQDYFRSDKENLGGFWKRLYVVFPDGNVQLR